MNGMEALRNYRAVLDELAELKIEKFEYMLEHINPKDRTAIEKQEMSLAQADPEFKEILNRITILNNRKTFLEAAIGLARESVVEINEDFNELVDYLSEDEEWDDEDDGEVIEVEVDEDDFEVEVEVEEEEEES